MQRVVSEKQRPDSVLKTLEYSIHYIPIYYIRNIECFFLETRVILRRENISSNDNLFFLFI